MSETAAEVASAPASTAAKALLVLAVVLAGFGAITARVVVSGEAELAASDAALEAGDAREATVRARRAAAWYAPGAPHVDAAYRRLIALARAAEDHKRADIALLAWRGVRTSALDSRWLYLPHRADLDQANREIARLAKAGAPEGEPGAQVAAAHLQLLSRRQAPRTPWVVMLLAAFMMAACGIAWWARAVSAPAGRMLWARARGASALTIVGVALWLLSVWQA